eukprot:717677-Heterocapsa_arctica.AAC.1
MATARIKRCLWAIRGWPTIMVGVLRDGRQAGFTVAAFKADLAAYENLNQQPDQSNAMQELSN